MDLDGVVTDFEEVLTDYLGRLYQVPLSGTPEERVERTSTPSPACAPRSTGPSRPTV